MRLPDFTLPRALAFATLLVYFQNSEAASGINKQIIGGHPAVKGQFPWQAHVWSPNLEGGLSFCGGSIISSTWILTAGHCHHGYLPNTAYIGGVNYRGYDAESIVRDFKQFFKHPNYVPVYTHGVAMNDIALIQLASKLHWSANILPVFLPSRSQPPLYRGTQIVASGFGRIVEKKVEKPDILQTVDLILGDDAYCTRVFLLCTISQREGGIYIGDSGGPWVWKDQSGVNRLVGISKSQSGSISSDGITSRATDVHHYLDWIGRRTGIHIDN